jgi:hypothetical protein
MSLVHARSSDTWPHTHCFALVIQMLCRARSYTSRPAAVPENPRQHKLGLVCCLGLGPDAIGGGRQPGTIECLTLVWIAAMACLMSRSCQARLDLPSPSARTRKLFPRHSEGRHPEGDARSDRPHHRHPGATLPAACLKTATRMRFKAGIRVPCIIIMPLFG